jgi:hypothetical protein
LMGASNKRRRQGQRDRGRRTSGGDSRQVRKDFAMSVVPRKIGDRIVFYEAHVQPFTDNHAAIGITSAEAADLASKTAAARAAFEARTAAQQLAEAATLTLRDADAAMSLAGATLIEKIRAKARQVGGNSVYSLAQIPAPDLPSPVGAPGKPYQCKVTLKEDGSLEMIWKCDNPVNCTGVVYQVFRSIGGSVEFSYLGGSGQKLFIDNTIPAGATQLTYKVQGVRTTAAGDWATFNVNFGTNAGGMMTASVSESPKLAA